MFGGESVLVQGGITHDGKTRLVVLQGNINAQMYFNDILEPEAIPFLR